MLAAMPRANNNHESIIARLPPPGTLKHCEGGCDRVLPATREYFPMHNKSRDGLRDSCFDCSYRKKYGKEPPNPLSPPAQPVTSPVIIVPPRQVVVAEAPARLEPSHEVAHTRRGRFFAFHQADGTIARVNAEWIISTFQTGDALVIVTAGGTRNKLTGEHEQIEYYVDPADVDRVLAYLDAETGEPVIDQAYQVIAEKNAEISRLSQRIKELEQREREWETRWQLAQDKARRAFSY